MSYDEMELDKIGDRKTALFLIMSDTDTTFNFVIAMLQSQSQLKAMYKDSADTILGNCDTTLFLGGKEKTTLKEMSELLIWFLARYHKDYIP